MALPDFSSIAKSVTNFAQGKLTPRGGGTAFDLLNPANARRAISGLFAGGASSASKTTPNIGFSDSTAQGGASAAGEDDWRVRLSLADNATIFYKSASGQKQGDIPQNNSIMDPLIETNGVIWPYTPSIQVSHVANYSTAQLTHSNYPAHFYNNSEVADITISGEFTVQSVDEGRYLMAAIYFLRSATKMFFGQGADAGNPPPILFLDGYGSHYFPHVPCVVTNFTHNLSNDVDYIQVPITQSTLEEVAVTAPDNENIGSVQLSDEEQNYVPSLLRSNKAAPTTKMQYTTITSTTRVPTASTVSVTLRPIYSRQNLHESFNLNDFARGKLIGDKKKGYGGFL
jgi:hypothetical protein